MRIKTPFSTSASKVASARTFDPISTVKKFVFEGNGRNPKAAGDGGERTHDAFGGVVARAVGKSWTGRWPPRSGSP